MLDSLIPIIFAGVLLIIITFIIVIVVKYKKHHHTEHFAETNDYFSADDIKQITSLSTGSNVPIGTILPYYNEFNSNNLTNLINDGYLPCDGGNSFTSLNKPLGELLNESNKTKVYELTHIVNDEIKNIIIPDLRHQYLAGAGSRIEDDKRLNDNETPNYELGDILGSEKHKLSIDEMPEHKHEIIEGGEHTHELDSFMSKIGNNWGGRENRSEGTAYNKTPHNDGKHKHDMNNAGGSKEHENRPPTVVVNYIIYVGDMTDDTKSKLIDLIKSN